jgi:hypothetical protein
MAPKKSTERKEQNPSHWNPEPDATTWSSARGKGGGEGGQGRSDQEYGHSPKLGERSKKVRPTRRAARPSAKP